SDTASPSRKIWARWPLSTRALACRNANAALVGSSEPQALLSRTFMSTSRSPDVAGPFGVDGRPARSRSVLGEERALDPGLEQRVVAGEGAGGDVRGVDDLADGRLVDTPRPAGHVELVVDLAVREGVEGVAAVAEEVGELRRVVADEDVEPAVRDHRADGM